MTRKEYLKQLRFIASIESTSKTYLRMNQILHNYLDEESGTCQAPRIKEIIDFVNKIERRNGWATMKDCWIDLLRYFEYVSLYYNKKQGPKDIDSFEPEMQFLYMYEYLKEFKHKIESQEWVVVEIEDMDFAINYEETSAVPF